MRLTNLKIQNYRQLRDLNLNFQNKSEHDLHIFIGTNGSGKSNILNAINWCLYFEEPHLHDESLALPLLNLELIKKTDKGNIENVKVELKVETNDGKDIIFTRESSYRILEDKIEPFEIDMKFDVTITDRSGDTKLLEGEEAIEAVDRFVPNSIREYFFFDGERLDKYFQSATGAKIKDSVFEISQVQLLEIMKDRLEKVHSDLNRDITKNSPDLDKINTEYLVLKEKYSNIKEDIYECRDQIDTSKMIIAESEEYLRGLPDIEELENRRDELNGNIKLKQELLNKEIIKKQDALREYSKLVYLYPSMKNVLEIIDVKNSENKLPPNLNKGILKGVLDKNHCLVCDRELDRESTEYVNNLIKKISLTSGSLNKLMKMEPILEKYLNELKVYKDIIEDTQIRINDYKKDIDNISKDIDNINRNIGGYKDKEEITKKHRQRMINEELLEENIKEEGRNEERKKKLKKNMNEKKRELDKAIGKDHLNKQLNIERLFSEDAIEAIDRVKKIIMDENRIKIEEETGETFLSLIWKKDTFDKVAINDDYNLSLKHKDGYECLGSCSAAEKALLALSFTLSLHKVSGFLSPIVIDTPISRVSDANRTNFAEVLKIVSRDKQIILLFTPSEYSEEISMIFDVAYSTKSTLNPTEDKTTVKEEKRW